MTRLRLTLATTAVVILTVVAMSLLVGFWSRTQTANTARRNCVVLRHRPQAFCLHTFPRPSLIP